MRRMTATIAIRSAIRTVRFITRKAMYAAAAKTRKNPTTAAMPATPSSDVISKEVLSFPFVFQGGFDLVEILFGHFGRLGRKVVFFVGPRSKIEQLAAL